MHFSLFGSQSGVVGEERTQAGSEEGRAEAAGQCDMSAHLEVLYKKQGPAVMPPAWTEWPVTP